MFCSKCGTKIDDDSRFCNGCGVEIVLESQSENKECHQEKVEKCKKREKRIFTPWIVILLMMLISTIVCVRVSSFTCTKCQEKKIGQKYYSKIYSQRILCEKCIDEYYPNTWQVYYEVR